MPLTSLNFNFQSVCCSVHILVVLAGRVDQILLFVASIVIRANFILILSGTHVHGLFVDALEEEHGEQAANVREDEEYPDVFSTVNVALEEDGPEEAHRGAGLYGEPVTTPLASP